MSSSRARRNPSASGSASTAETEALLQHFKSVIENQQSAPSTEALPRCSHCKKELRDSNPKRCAACKSVYYCDQSCQKSDWPMHKVACQYEKHGQEVLRTIADTALSDAVVCEMIRSEKYKWCVNWAATHFVRPGTTPRLIPKSEKLFPEIAGDSISGVLKRWTPLHEAAAANRVEVVKTLFAEGAAPDPRDIDGETPLWLAVENNSAEMVKALCAGGADPNLPARDGWTAIMCAARDGKVAVVRALLDGGARVTGPADMFGRETIDLVEMLINPDPAMPFRRAGVSQSALLEVKSLVEAAIARGM